MFNRRMRTSEVGETSIQSVAPDPLRASSSAQPPAAGWACSWIV